MLCALFFTFAITVSGSNFFLNNVIPNSTTCLQTLSADPFQIAV